MYFTPFQRFLSEAIRFHKIETLEVFNIHKYYLSLGSERLVTTITSQSRYTIEMQIIIKRV